jgi:predicted AlkP superfamily phosphohydrolase/phosphomutase
MKPKVLVIGLDAAPPKYLFEDWKKDLPALRGLMEQGSFAKLRSVDPPITVPAWSCMLSGRSPAELGIYGFKTRKDNAYFESEPVTQNAVHAERVWDILGRHGKKSLLLGVPQTYPARKIEGWSVGCFLTPSLQASCVYPEALREELLNVVPDFMFDVASFRREDRRALLAKLNRMADGHFCFFEHLLKTKPWDFSMIVEIGTDRVQHAFWADFDPAHPLHRPGSEFASAVRDYYRKVDGWIARLLAAVGPEVTVFVVSDHGAKAMEGGIALNEWLFRKGYLHLKKYPDRVTPLEDCEVDWTKTVAWAAGGYAGRVYLNLRNREPCGSVPESDFRKLRERLKSEIEHIPGLGGKTLTTRVMIPEEIYGDCAPGAPDLTVYFDELRYRTLGSVGSADIALLKNDQGWDGANHDWDGIFIVRGTAAGLPAGPNPDLPLNQIMPMILKCFGLEGEIQSGRKGPQKVSRNGGGGLSESEKKMLDERLRSLGYLG